MYRLSKESILQWYHTGSSDQYSVLKYANFNLIKKVILIWYMYSVIKQLTLTDRHVHVFIHVDILDRMVKLLKNLRSIKTIDLCL